jgi:hypothetical protein
MEYNAVKKALASGDHNSIRKAVQSIYDANRLDVFRASTKELLRAINSQRDDAIKEKDYVRADKLAYYAREMMSAKDFDELQKMQPHLNGILDGSVRSPAMTERKSTGGSRRKSSRKRSTRKRTTRRYK